MNDMRRTGWAYTWRAVLLAAVLTLVMWLYASGCSTTRITDDIVAPTKTVTTVTAPDGTVTVTESQRPERVGVRESFSAGLWPGQPQGSKHGTVKATLKSITVGESGGEWMVGLGGGFGVLFIIGALVCVAGVVFWAWLKMPSLGIGLLLVGAGLIFTGFMMEEFPVFLFVLILIAVGVAVFFAWKGGVFTKLANAWKKATTQTVAGIEALKDGKTPEERQAINDALKAEQDNDVRELVDAAGATPA